MKKILSAVLALAMVLSFSVTTAITAAAENTAKLLSVEDYEVSFPDPVLKEYMILNFDSNKDGKIQKSEITFKEHVYINLSNTDVVDTEGLQEVSYIGESPYDEENPPRVENGGWDDWGGAWYDAGEPHIIFDFSNSKVKNIAPLFEAVKNNNYNKLVVIQLRQCYEIKEEDFDKIKILNRESQAFLSLDLYNTYNISDYSPLQGYKVIGLNCEACYIREGFFSNYLSVLLAHDSIGYGLITVLENSPIKMLSLSNNYVNYMWNINSLNTLYIGGWGSTEFSDDDLAQLMSKNFYNLQDITLYNTQVTDLTPLYESNVFSLIYKCNYSLAGTISIDGKTLGDHLLSQIPNIPLLENVTISECNVTDLTPLASIDASRRMYIRLPNNWISLEYKNNKAIYDHLNEIAYDSLNVDDQRFESSSSDSYTDGKGTSLLFETSVNKKSVAVGDTVTETVKITNNGTVPASFEMFFNVHDVEWDKIDIQNGSRRQSVKNLAPGKSITKTISYSLNKKSSYSYNYIKSGVLLTIGSDVDAVSFSSLPMRENVSLYTAGTAMCGRPMSIRGTCSPDMKSVQIQTSDGEVIATISDYAGGTSFSGDITIPEKYWPAVGSKKTISLKAVVTDEEGRTYSSYLRSVNVINPDVNSNLDIEDCHYMVYGSSHQYGELEPAIMYYGDRVIVRAKFAGVEPEDIVSAKAVINGSTYDMIKYIDGKYAGYYGALSTGLTSGDYLDILLRVTTKSGEVLEKLVGYGRILIDPSGIITDPNGNPIEGVKVTLQKKQANGSWANWDAENYGQTNPMYTNENGYYGWDVPEGTYRIIAEKEGYVTKTVEEYYSRNQGEMTQITVLPPRTDVDFSMEYADPANPPVSSMSDEDAKTAIQSMLSTMKLSAKATDEDVSAELMKGLPDNIYVSFKNGTYVKTDSTNETEGSIKGTLYIENLSKDSSQELQVNIPLNAASLDSESTPIKGKFYSYQVTAQGGNSGYKFKLAAGIIPEGLSVDENGTISGIPMQAGLYKMLIKATKSGLSEKIPFSMYVLPQVVKVKVTAPTDAAAGTACTATAVCYDANDTNCATPLTDVSATLTYGSDAKTSVTEAGVYAIHVSVPNGYVISEVIGDQYITVKAAE